MKQGHELAGIEILRFVCALGVLFWHYQHFFFVGEWDPAAGELLRPALPMYDLFFVFYNNGSLAVPFFWVISGFIFYWHYYAPIQAHTVGFSDFLVRRFSRLYPLHVVTLILVIIEQYFYYRSHQTYFIYIWNKPIWFASQLLFASNWFARQPESFNGPIWSVSIEVVIYLFFFFIARKLPPNIFIGAFIAGLFSIASKFFHTLLSPQIYACGMYFFAGGVAQRLSTHHSALATATVTCAAILASLAFGFCSINAVSILFLAASSVVVFAKLGETIFGGSLRRFAFLGNATYASYLLHFPIQLLLVIAVDAMGWSRQIFFSSSALLLWLGMVITLSLVVHRYLEMPVQRIIRGCAKHLLASSPLRSDLSSGSRR